jgi:hypothetical protein
LIAVGSPHVPLSVARLQRLICETDIEFGEVSHSGDSSVKNIGIKVRSVRPGDGPKFRIDANLSEVRGIAHRFENSPEAEIMCEIDHAFNTVLELQMQSIIAEYSCSNDVL